MIDVRHLGMSGLHLAWAGAAVCVDPPRPIDAPVVVTWSEHERVAGARAAKGPVAGDASVLAFVGAEGLALEEGRTMPFAGFTLTPTAYRPIPYATPPEAMRKTLSALRAPRVALRRLVFTLGRPAALPLAVLIARGGKRVAVLGQALHRFVSDAELERLVRWAGTVDLLVAGTDYDDEAATGAMMGAFDARQRVIADLTGPIRRALGLPVRPLEVALRSAPAETRVLDDGQELVL